MITHIVLDMGGVLVQLEWAERIGPLLGQAIAIDDLHRLWVNAKSTTDFESGRLEFDDFATAFIQEFDLSVSSETVKHEFLEFVQGPMLNCNQVLAWLKGNYALSLLSNTNPAHYDRLRDRYDFFQYFDQLFLSYKIGLMKPDPAIFHYVSKHLKASPESIAFFDDSTGNVEAARSVGMQAYRVDSPDEVYAIAQTWKQT